MQMTASKKLIAFRYALKLIKIKKKEIEMVLRSFLFSEKYINSLISVLSTKPHYGGQIIVHASMPLSNYGLIRLFNRVQLHILRPRGYRQP